MLQKRGIVLIVVLGVVLLLSLLGSAILKRTVHQYGSIFHEMKRIKAYHLLEGTSVEVFYRQSQEELLNPGDGGDSFLIGDSWHGSGNYNDTHYEVEDASVGSPLYPRDAGDSFPPNPIRNVITLESSLEEVKIHAPSP